MFKGKYCLVCLFVLSAYALPAQNNKNASSLLWRISGNGLNKPSYLFGTVHLRNKSLFNFTDSLYHSLESTDGFAMELDPENISLAVADQMESQADKVYVKDKLNKAEYEAFRKKLKKEFGLNAEELTVKEFHNLRDKLLMPENGADDMSTFMDAWLYSIAKGQGKTIRGLEDLADQLDNDGAENSEIAPGEAKQLFAQVKRGRKYVKQMLDWYARQDIHMLQKYAQLSSSEEDRNIFSKRNHKMAFRFDSLIREKSTYFVAIGAAHLAGDDGVIALMRQKGYVVEPVLSSVRLPASAYTFKKAELSWQEVSEPTMGYSVMMPGSPTASEMLDGEMKIRMYYDLGNGVLYYASFMRPMIAITDANKDSLFTNMVNANIEKGSEVISRKPITRFGMPGMEIYYKSKLDQMYLRMQVLAWQRRLYIIMTGSQKQEFTGSYSDRFFSSFRVHEMQSSVWSEYHAVNDAFKINFPGNPEVTVLPPSNTDSTMKATRYMAAMDKEGLYFFVIVSRTVENFIIPDDAVYFDGVLKHMESQDYQFTDTPVRSFTDGYPMLRLSASQASGLQLQSQTVIRGNRIYSIMAMYQKGDNNQQVIDQFFQSFKPAAYPVPVLRKFSNDDNQFTVDIPGASLVNNTDTTQHKISTYYAYDSVSATTLSITRKKLSSYYWVNTDTSFFNGQQRQLLSETDSLVSRKMISDGIHKGMDLLIKRNGIDRLHRTMLWVCGTDLYFLESDYTRREPLAAAERFFQSFRLADKKHAADIFINKPSKLFNDLLLGDSAAYEAAYEAVNELDFEKADAALLLKYALYTYRTDTVNLRSVNSILLQKLGDLRDVSLVSSVKESYRKLLPAQEKYKYALLVTLAKMHTADSYAAISELITERMPSEGNAARFIAELHDSLSLTRQLMPDLLAHLQDTLLSLPLSYLQLTMLDSNLMSRKDILPFEKDWISVANRYLPSIDENNLYSGTYDSDLVTLLLAYNTPEANKAASGFLQSSQVYLQKIAALGLLKNGIPMQAQTAEKIAADKYHRVAFYQNLEKLGKQNLFPAKYLNQKSFAESYLYGAFDDETPQQVTYIGERTAVFKGEKKKFYLYKVVFTDDTETYTYLGVSGPFGLQAADIIAEDAYPGIWNEPFEQSKISRQFAEYLAQFEELNDREK